MNYSTTLGLVLVLTLLGIPPAQSVENKSKLKTYTATGTHKCLPPEVIGETLCEKIGKENDVMFPTEPMLRDALQIDIRPENCQSFFDDYLHTRRGLRIESALEKSQLYSRLESTVTTFPVVDFFGNGEARVVKTRDLAADSFNDINDENALYDQILRDAEDINHRFMEVLERDKNITSTVHGKTTSIDLGDIDQIYLDLIVQTGLATETQTSQIVRAKEEIFRRWGYRLQVIEIP